MPKMKSVAKNEIVLHDPYSNALCPSPYFLTFTLLPKSKLSRRMDAMFFWGVPCNYNKLFTSDPSVLFSSLFFLSNCFCKNLFFTTSTLSMERFMWNPTACILRVRKATFIAFPHFRKGTSAARNDNLRPVLKSGLLRGNAVSNLLTFGHWKVVFSLFPIL